jgi:hypothetical protein
MKEFPPISSHTSSSGLKASSFSSKSSSIPKINPQIEIEEKKVQGK